MDYRRDKLNINVKLIYISDFSIKVTPDSTFVFVFCVYTKNYSVLPFVILTSWKIV